MPAGDGVEITKPDGTKYTAKRLECGCVGECDPYAHDTAWDWDGKPSPPSWDDLSPAEQKTLRAIHIEIYGEELEP